MRSSLEGHLESFFMIAVTALLISGIFYIRDPTLFDPEFSEKTEGVVTKVIDGDTVIVEGERVRLAGIDTDERGYPCYHDAKKKMETLVLGKEVKLERAERNKDQYGRLLRYLYLNDTNLNVQMVREGYAVARFSQNTRYKSEISEAEDQAMKNNAGCKWSNDNWLEESNEKTESEETEHNSSFPHPCEAKKLIGENVTLEGKVIDFGKTENAIFLNFGSPYPNSCFTAVIFSEKWSEFPEKARKYENSRVRLKGKIEEYKRTPQIVLEERGQLKFLR